MNFFILAPGRSLTLDMVGQVMELKGPKKIIAVTSAYRICPFADFIVSQDRHWWEGHPDAKALFGRKFSVNQVAGVERIHPTAHILTGTNSGLAAVHLAALENASAIYLLGFDMKGDHFFGQYPAPFKPTPDHRYKRFMVEFDNWRRSYPKPVIVNCNLDSDLATFPRVSFDKVMEQLCLISYSAAPLVPL